MFLFILVQLSITFITKWQFNRLVVVTMSVMSTTINYPIVFVRKSPFWLHEVNLWRFCTFSLRSTCVSRGWEWREASAAPADLQHGEMSGQNTSHFSGWGFKGPSQAGKDALQEGPDVILGFVFKIKLKVCLHWNKTPCERLQTETWIFHILESILNYQTHIVE